MPEHLTIDIDKIRISDLNFFLHHEIHSEPLLHSVREVGVLSPPLVQEISAGHFRIVCGFRRVQAALECGIRKLACKVLPSDIDDLKLLSISIHDNLNYHPLEKSIIIKKLEPFLDKDELLGKYFPLLGLHEKFYEQITCLARLEDNIQDALHKGDLAQETAWGLYNLDRQDRQAAFELLEKLRLSVSKQKEVMENLCEISLREPIKLHDLVNSGEIQKNLCREKLSISQKSELIRSYLHKKRFPRITQTEEKFLQIRRSLRLSNGIKLSPPPSFENDTYRIEFSFKSVDDLGKKIRKLEKTRENSSWQELFRLT